MNYMGGKQALSRHILPIIQGYLGFGRIYVEPFVGGGNVIDKIPGPRLAADINPYLIEMWKAAADGWMPPKQFSLEQYKSVQSDKDSDPVLAGYVGFALSYGGKFFGGWARGKTSKGVPRDYVDEAYRSARAQFPKMVGVHFVLSSYENLNVPAGAVVYCDPPYRGTTKYAIGRFDHDNFYEWCANQAKRGCDVFVSEYDMPQPFVPVWQKERADSLTANTGAKRSVERLYHLPSMG